MNAIRNKINLIKSYLLDELDKILALVGVIFSSALTIWSILVIGHPTYTMIGIIVFIVCVGYLFIRRFVYPSLISSLDELRCSNSFYITLNILFFLLLSYSIISIYLRQDPYVRPLEYFISVALMAVIVANDILFLSHQKSRIYFTLFKIIIIGLSLVYSQILIFPSILGIDPWRHQWFTLKILDNGHIPEDLGYSKLPLMHLMIGMISLVTDLGYKMATMISISSLQIICDALFVFLLGKLLISTKVGLLAALLLELSSYHIHLSYWTIPNTMAATLILPLIFMLLKIRKDKPFIGYLIIMLLMGTLILTHTITTMCFAILLFIFWAGSEAYTRLFHQETGRSVTWMICILFSTMMLAYWSYISGHILTLANLIKWGFRGKIKVEYYSQYLSEFSFEERLFANLGIYLYFAISFFGFFYMMSKQFRNRNRFITTIGEIVILFIASIPLMVGKDIISDRWQYFSQILLAIPLSLSLFLLNGVFKNHFIKVFLMSVSFFALSFLLIMNPIANMDNRILSPNSGFRYAFTESELYGMDTISRIWNGIIGGDWYSHFHYEFQLDQEFLCIGDSFYNENFSDLQEILIIVREEILKNPFKTTYGMLRLKYDLNIALCHQNFSRIYNCGSISGYLKP